MKTNNQAGLSTIHIIAILAALAVLFGIISSMSGSDESAAITTQNEISGIEAAAQNIAENKAESAVEAATERAALIDEALVPELNAAPEADTTDSLPEEVVTAIPTANLPANEIASNEPETKPAPAAEPEPVVATSGTFTDYDPSLLAAGETNILFFHANWCPSCRGLENDLNANLSAIPAGVNILKLDYDSETELKKDYGVIRQHTLVVVDGNGNEIKKLTGPTNTLNQVVSQL